MQGWKRSFVQPFYAKKFLQTEDHQSPTFWEGEQMNRIHRNSKKSFLLNMLDDTGTVTLGSAAAALYSCDDELNRLRVVRLLAAYRSTSPGFPYHVRDGMIVSIPS